jgi:hypothetical protein
VSLWLVVKGKAARTEHTSPKDHPKVQQLAKSG